MHQNPQSLKEVRENLAEAAYTAWIDKTFVPRATVMVNAMGKHIASVACEIKAAELGVEHSMIPEQKFPLPKKRAKAIEA